VHAHGSRQVELVGEPIDADHGDVVVCEGGDDLDRATRKPVPIPDAIRALLEKARASSRYARPMPLVSKTVEVAAPAESIMAIVADFESYPLWNEEIKGCWVLARYEDGRPSQLRLDVVVQGQSGTFITAVYYPDENQIYTVLQQGDHLEKQDQKFSVVPIGATSLLTVDLDVETKLPIPKPMVKKAIGDTLDYLADNLKARAEQLAASP
jgi:ribosome-associated toxin RatA of RatAB toxin-antitoxin module